MQNSIRKNKKNNKMASVVMLSLCVIINLLICDVAWFCKFVQEQSILSSTIIIVYIFFTLVLLYRMHNSESDELSGELKVNCALTAYTLIVLWVRASQGYFQKIMLMGAVLLGIILSVWLCFTIKTDNKFRLIVPILFLTVGISCATMNVNLKLSTSSKDYWKIYTCFFLPRLYTFLLPATTVFVDTLLDYRKRDYADSKEVGHKLDKLAEAAEHGNQEAQYELGELYYFGDCGVEADTKKAINYFIMAAENGSVQAEMNLGGIFFNDNSGMKNIQESLKWYRRASVHGHPEAQYSLGTFYYNGIGVEQDYTEAVRLFRLSAEQNCPEGQHALWKCYKYGSGVEKNMQRGIKWLKKAADNNLPKAQFELWRCYYNGTGVEKNAEKAYNYLTKAYENGNSDACYTLGRYYFDGEIVPQDDEKAFSLFKRAAESGNEFAMYYLGRCLHEGRGTEINNSQAVKWLKVAAKTIPISQFYLGWLYYDGTGIKHDYDKAFDWIKKAAENGYPEGALCLAEFYEKGHGTKKDLSEAKKWYSVADSRGAVYYHDAVTRI